MTEISKSKAEQRKEFIKKRNFLKQNNKSASLKLSENLGDLLYFKNSKNIASFISMKSEISTNSLNDYILKSDKILCLPTIKNNSELLTFKEYKPGSKLIAGKFGVMEPHENNQEILPEVILTPCLAFDKLGFRLGYGGGYYDRTLLMLKKIKHKFVSIAVAFDEQESTNVIHDENDQRINYILTEKRLYEV
mgnify:CR=1 FL=1